MTPKKKSAKPSLLARLFGAKPAKANPTRKKSAKEQLVEKKPAAQKVASAPKPPLPTPLDRSIAEIKTMARIGENNPSRLATILGNILKAEQAKKAQADEKYQKLIQDILARQQKEQQEPPPSG